MKKRLEDALESMREIAARVVGEAGLEVVELAVNRAPKRWHLRLDIDRAGPRGVGLDDCQRVSRELEAELDRLDPLDHAYTLEVSSPGLDRPIRTSDDVRRNTGRLVDVEIREPIDGRRSFSGVLLGLDGDRILVREGEDSEIRVPLEMVVLARQHVPF